MLIFYMLAIVGAVMVYGSGRILKLFKIEVNNKSIVIMKFSGLVVALVGMLKLMNVY